MANPCIFIEKVNGHEVGATALRIKPALRRAPKGAITLDISATLTENSIPIPNDEFSVEGYFCLEATVDVKVRCIVELPDTTHQYAPDHTFSPPFDDPQPWEIAFPTPEDLPDDMHSMLSAHLLYTDDTPVCGGHGGIQIILAEQTH